MLELFPLGTQLNEIRLLPVNLLAQLTPRRQPPITLNGVVSNVTDGCHTEQWQHTKP